MKGVIFDMDGVIFDTERLYMRCCVEVGEELGLQNVEEVCKKCIGISSAGTDIIMTENFGEGFSAEEFKKSVGEHFVKYFKDGKHLIKTGVPEILEYLKANGFKVALASSTVKSAVERELESAGLIQYFDELVCGDMVSKSKPEPDIFLEAAKRINSTPDECIVIEDSLNGIRAAYSAGMKAIMVPDIIQPDDEMREKAWKIVPTLVEAKKIIEER